MTKELIVIAAVARNGAIGKDSRLPWRLPEDMARFKALTLGQAVIMGRKTWESLPARFRPLPGRQNIVVTRQRDYRAEGAIVAHTLDEALAQVDRGRAACVIGGGEMYALALPRATRLELTEIDADFAADAFFPSFDRGQWREAARESHRAENGLAYAFVRYERTQST